MGKLFPAFSIKKLDRLSHFLLLILHPRPPPCTPAAHYARAGRGVTVYWLKYLDPTRCCRRVTQPPHTAGPLAFICSHLQTFRDYNVRLCPIRN